MTQQQALEADARARFPGQPIVQGGWIHSQTKNPTFDYSRPKGYLDYELATADSAYEMATTGSVTPGGGNNSLLVGMLVLAGGAGLAYILWKRKR